MKKTLLVFLMTLLAVVGSGCGVKGKHIKPDYSLRNLAVASFLHRVEMKYGQFWYDDLTDEEKEELTTIDKMKPRLVVVEQIDLNGFGAESIRFKEHLGANKNEAIDLPNLITVPSP